MQDHIAEYLGVYFQDTGRPQPQQTKIRVSDQFLCGGYGQFDPAIEEWIDYAMKSHGLPLDPTYTGKAFRGMMDFLSQQQITGKNILFLHTGGLPLYFDYLNSKR